MTPENEVAKEVDKQYDEHIKPIMNEWQLEVARLRKALQWYAYNPLWAKNEMTGHRAIDALARYTEEEK